MGSWYNLEGEALSNCILQRCGSIPAPLIGMVSPAQRAEYEAKKSAWMACKEKCQKFKIISSGDLSQVQNKTTNTPTPDSVGTGGIMDTRPTQVDSDSVVVPKVSTNMKIGLVVGAAAVIGLWLYFRKK